MECWINGTMDKIYDSSVIYKDSDGYCTRVTGRFFHNESFIQYINDKKFSYITSNGDNCGDNNFYKVIYYFNDVKGNTKVKYDELTIPNIDMNPDCEKVIDISVDFEKSTKHLLIQILFNDYWIISGILFLLIGVYLMLLAQNKKATTFVNSIILGEIFSFTVGCGIVGLNIKYMEWCIFAVGILFGLFLGYFSLEKKKLFRGVLGINGGFIFGIIMFDFIFCHQNFHIAEIILTDSILIFIGLGLVVVYLAPIYHYFFDSVIGSYIFIRGISILMQKLGKYARFRELQFILYLLNRYEFDYAKWFFKEQWPIYFVYDIFMVIFMGISMFYYYTKAVGKDEDDDEKDEPNSEEKLIGAKKTTSTAINDEELD